MNAQLSVSYNNATLTAGQNVPIDANKCGTTEDAEFVFTLNNAGDTTKWDIVVTAENGNTFSVASVCGNICNTGNHSVATVPAGESKVVSAHFSVPCETAVGTAETFVVSLVNKTTSNEDFAFNVTITYKGNSITDVQTIDNTVFAYPNPATDNVYVSYSIKGCGQLVVTDITGRQILEQPVNNDGIISINVERFHKGVYLYGIRTGNSLGEMKKLVVK